MIAQSPPLPVGSGIGGHTRPNQGRTVDWITPRYVLDALGPFDLDPCASVLQPWPCATESYTEAGLSRPWAGRVWLNPPYSAHSMWQWVMRLADHGDGCALIFARTETAGFARWVWGRADAILFLHGRLTFCLPDGRPGSGNSGGPSCLVAYGSENVDALRRCGLPGSLVSGWKTVAR